MFPVLQVSKCTLKFILCAHHIKSLCTGVQENQKAGMLAIYNFILFFYIYNAEDYATFKSISFFFFLFLQLSETIASWQTRSNEDKTLNTLGDSSTACYSHYCLLCLSTLRTHTRSCVQRRTPLQNTAPSHCSIFLEFFSLARVWCHFWRATVIPAGAMQITTIVCPLRCFQGVKK